MFSHRTRRFRLVTVLGAFALTASLAGPVLAQEEAPVVEVSASDDTATETGPTAGSFAITRTGDLSAELDVHYTVTGTATSGDDYVALTGTATFATDQAISIVTVTPVDDTEVEGDETVILTLDTDTAYTIGDNNQATITISDNDQEPLPEINVTASDDTATEEGPTTGVYTFTRTGDLSAELDVHYTVTGTATSGDDYVALTGTATFATDQAISIVTVTPVDDTEVEGDETVILTLDTDTAYTIGDNNQATITISDNDQAPDEPTDPMPLIKADCKNSGWIGFTVFKNQGDCVSYIATAGKNPPALSGGGFRLSAAFGPPPFIMNDGR